MKIECTVDELWDALREIACATKPFTDAKTIVMLRRHHIVETAKKLQVKNK